MSCKLRHSKEDRNYSFVLIVGFVDNKENYII